MVGKMVGKMVVPTTIEQWPIARLIPNARNARTQSDKQVAELAGSIREFGWTNPVLVDEPGDIIAGHGRVLAARQLKMAEVPVMYDPFLGSGTTVIAAEQTGRVAFGAELNEPYVDVIVKRWQAFTGLSATLDGSGETFAEVTARRALASATSLP